MIHVDADSRDDFVPGGLGQYTCAFFMTNQDVVGPPHVGHQIGDLAHRLADGQTQGQH